MNNSPPPGSIPGESPRAADKYGMRWGVIGGLVAFVAVAGAFYVFLAGWVHENTCYELLPTPPESVGLRACVNLSERWDYGGVTMQPYPAMYL